MNVSRKLKIALLTAGIIGSFELPIPVVAVLSRPLRPRSGVHLRPSASPGWHGARHGARTNCQGLWLEARCSETDPELLPSARKTHHQPGIKRRTRHE